MNNFCIWSSNTSSVFLSLLITILFYILSFYYTLAVKIALHSVRVKSIYNHKILTFVLSYLKLHVKMSCCACHCLIWMMKNIIIVFDIINTHLWILESTHANIYQLCHFRLNLAGSVNKAKLYSHKKKSYSSFIEKRYIWPVLAAHSCLHC